jgi:rfaE bifunctional protein nucleotidyltransferase chain/domain
MTRNSNQQASKIYTWADLSTLTSKLQADGSTLALCHGVFDLLHPGHIQHFKVARKLAEVLIVSITADVFVNKGPGRPIFNQEIRAETLAALQDVDYVVICEKPTAVELLNEIKPNYYVKGSDYLNAVDDVTGMIVKEREALEKHGGQIYFTDEMTSSSSLLINKYFSNIAPDAQEWIKKFKLDHGYDQVVEALDKIQELNVLLLGETIIDQYTYCSPLAKSSKDPILAFHQHKTNLFPGGVLTIANNCSSWVKQVKVISFSAPQDSTLDSLMWKMNSNVATEFIKTTDRPTILKHRYVESGSNTRVFEYYDFSEIDLPAETSDAILSAISKQVSAFDLVLAADYGHGFFSSKTISFLGESNSNLSVNTQANAGNRGYNTISKYPRADFITMNGAELQLELRNRNPDYQQIVPVLVASMKVKCAIVTLGADGLMVFDNKGGYEKVPALAGKLVDKVGAGDAVFAMASLLAKVGAPLKVIGFLSNLVAAHEVSQLGHEKSLSQADLRKHAKSILG